MQTLNLQQAAEFLKIHPVTLQAKAKSGEIPAAKPGKCWVFIDEDLVNYIRLQYTEHGKRIASKNGETQCSLNETKSGITNLLLVEKQYTDLLAPQTKQRHKK
jgi:excisionase family DNA binding protein